MYLSYKWAMRVLNDFIKEGRMPEVGFRGCFEYEYNWMYNILNPKLPKELL